MNVYAVVLALTNVRPSLFTMLTADIALLVVVVASLGLRRRMRRRKKSPADEAIHCGRCQHLIPSEKYNCQMCGWPHVPERDKTSSGTSEFPET